MRFRICLSPPVESPPPHPPARLCHPASLTPATDVNTSSAPCNVTASLAFMEVWAPTALSLHTCTPHSGATQSCLWPGAFLRGSAWRARQRKPKNRLIDRPSPTSAPPNSALPPL
eukprot:201321-Chlamydomonas_euryale.AAC.1